MLEAMRRGAQTGVAKLLFGLLVLSFGIWGVHDVFNGWGRGSIAKVGLDGHVVLLVFLRPHRPSRGVLPGHREATTHQPRYNPGRSRRQHSPWAGRLD